MLWVLPWKGEARQVSFLPPAANFTSRFTAGSKPQAETSQACRIDASGAASLGRPVSYIATQRSAVLANRPPSGCKICKPYPRTRDSPRAVLSSQPLPGVDRAIPYFLGETQSDANP